MTEKEITAISKFLSLVLRHSPERIGLELDEQGWTDVNALLQKAKKAGHSISPELLRHIVETNNKKRFAFDESGQKIRANQGHSVEVDLGYTPQVPPAILYHGTPERNLDSILKTGLDKRKRHHVHLSADLETAIKVGARHGKPCVLCVFAGRMHAAGIPFFRSDNGVWLVDTVPAAYLELKKP